MLPFDERYGCESWPVLPNQATLLRRLGHCKSSRRRSLRAYPNLGRCHHLSIHHPGDPCDHPDCFVMIPNLFDPGERSCHRRAIFRIRGKQTRAASFGGGRTEFAVAVEMAWFRLVVPSWLSPQFSSDDPAYPQKEAPRRSGTTKRRNTRNRKTRRSD